jgi:hypothetical protein
LKRQKNKRKPTMPEEKSAISSERLAKLETKMEMTYELLKEIRTDLKNTPTRAEFEKRLAEHEADDKEVHGKIEAALERLKKEQTSMAIKIGTILGVFGILGGYVIKLLLG